MISTLSIKERMAIKRSVMPKLAAEIRCHNFEEVNCGLRGYQALCEARRCLQCKDRGCVAGCPVGVSIPEFIAALASEDLPR